MNLIHFRRVSLQGRAKTIMRVFFQHYALARRYAGRSNSLLIAARFAVLHVCL